MEDPLVTPSVFVLYELAYSDTGASVAQSRQLVFYDVDDNRFYWCDESKQERISSQSLSLEDITDLYIGKQREVFLSDASVDDEQCFSIGTEDKTLDLRVRFRKVWHAVLLLHCSSVRCMCVRAYTNIQGLNSACMSPNRSVLLPRRI